MNKQITVKELLKKENLLTGELENICWHTNILYTEVSKVMKEFTEKEYCDSITASVLIELIKRSDPKSPTYSAKIDEKLTRLGLATDKFPGSRKCGIWTEQFYLDGENSSVDMYDSYVDSISEGVSLK